MSSYKILSYAEEYEMALVKIAVIKKLPNGKYTILSLKGKRLGIYDTKQQAVKKLHQIEWFKSHKKKASEDISYSSIMRKLNKENDKDDITAFQKAFKKMFDDALIAGEEHPDEIALEAATKCIAEKQYLMQKAASAINLGDAEVAGRYLADLVRFITRRISPLKRQESINNLKKKIYYLNEYQIASKRSPASASLGQAITLLKTILLEHSPEYTRKVLNSIVRHL